MSTEKMREDFEEWAASRGMPLLHQGPGYAAERTGMAWAAWQASRAAIEVELPSPHEGNFGWMHQDFAVQRAIEACGLKWKQGPKRTLSDIIDSLGLKVKP